MDRSILIEYEAMKKEIQDLRRRIEADKKELDKLNNTVVADSVSCGKKGKKPLRTVKIQGKPTAAIIRKKALLKTRLAKLEYLEIELLELTNQVEEYIEQIPKSDLRTMFRFYFMDGMTYPKVADQMNKIFPNRRVKYTDENVKKRIQRFFENVPQCPDEK